MEYKFLFGNSLESLLDRTHAAIEDGWEPNGTPFYDQTQSRWCQSVVKRSQKPDELRLKEPKRK